jgi:hypothetical protein
MLSLVSLYPYQMLQDINLFEEFRSLFGGDGGTVDELDGSAFVGEFVDSLVHDSKRP